MELIFEVDSWEELRANVLESTSLHFEDGPGHPRLAQLHYVKDELIDPDAVDRHRIRDRSAVKRTV
jgi:hypothetical protein